MCTSYNIGIARRFPNTLPPSSFLHVAVLHHLHLDKSWSHYHPWGLLSLRVRRRSEMLGEDGSHSAQRVFWCQDISKRNVVRGWFSFGRTRFLVSRYRRPGPIARRRTDALAYPRSFEQNAEDDVDARRSVDQHWLCSPQFPSSLS
jgi:hypothetical protein